MKFLQSLDFLSTEAKLTFNSKGEIRNKTVSGGIISTLCVLISLGFIAYYFYEYINKNNKSLITSTSTSNNLNLTDSHKIPFLLRLTDPKNRPYTNADRLYKVALKYWHSGDEDNHGNTYQETQDIPIEKCNINKHFGQYKDLFINITDLDTFYCPIIRPSNETIYGMYGDTNPFGYYHFYVYMCLNQSKDDICLDKESIQKTLSNTYIDMRSVDYSIDNTQPKKVSIPGIRTDRHMLSMTVYKRIWVYLNWVDFISDDGLVFALKSRDQFHQFDSFRYDVDLRNITIGTIPGTFTTITVLSTGKTIIYNRKFIKITEYLATMGGIINCMSTVAYVINFYSSKNAYYLRLIEEFMIQKEIQATKKKLAKAVNNNVNSNILNNNFVPKTTIAKTQIKLDYHSKKPKLSKSMKDKLHLHWYQRLLPLKITTNNSRYLIKKVEWVNKSLNVYEVMKCVINNQQVDSKVLKKLKNSDLMTQNTSNFGSNSFGYLTTGMNVLDNQKKKDRENLNKTNSKFITDNHEMSMETENK